MIPFNFHHLYYFFTVAQEGSVSRAAEKLRVVQPAVSHQLKQLEEYLGFDLFERKGKKLLLTEDGKHVLSYAREIFDLGKELGDSLKDRSLRNRLQIQIGVLNSIPRVFVVSLLKLILRIDPAIYISLHENNLAALAEGLKTHSLDMILTDAPYQGPRQEEMQNHLVGKSPIAFYASRQIALKVKNFPKDLGLVPMILPTAHSQAHHAVQEFFAKHRITPKVIAEIEDMEVLYRMVRDGIGAAPMNDFTVSGSGEKNHLVRIGGKFIPNTHDGIYLITRSRKNPHPLAQKIRDQFKIS